VNTKKVFRNDGFSPYVRQKGVTFFYSTSTKFFYFKNKSAPLKFAAIFFHNVSYIYGICSVTDAAEM